MYVCISIGIKTYMYITYVYVYVDMSHLWGCKETITMIFANTCGEGSAIR